MESIQRGGAQYNSLRGEETQWCKSNTLSHTHTHICVHTNTLTHTHTHTFTPAPFCSCFLLTFPSISFLYLISLSSSCDCLLILYPPSNTHTLCSCLYAKMMPNTEKAFCPKAVHPNSSIFHQKGRGKDHHTSELIDMQKHAQICSFSE